MKYFIKRVTDCTYDVESYFSEDDAVYYGLWLGGNDRCYSYNNELVENILDILDDIVYEIKAGNLTEVEDIYGITNSFIEKVSGNALTVEEALMIKDLAEEYVSGNYDKYDIYSEYLTIQQEEPYDNRLLTGGVQGDYIYAVYPINKVTSNILEYIEAVLFGLGNEYEIMTIPQEQPNFDVFNYVVDYCIEADEAKIRAWAAEALGCPVEEVELVDQWENED